ncbi:MAG: hypothetical protein LAT65_17230 [Saccharospirillum sp.]|nr:hypothetical protein [Saccharospirillum sp.]
MEHVLTTLAEGNPKARMLLLHDSKEPMDSPWMDQLANTINQMGVDVLRWELCYMHLRRTQPKRRWSEPSLYPKMGELDVFMDQLTAIATDLPLILAGKGAGARLVTAYAAKYSPDSLAALVSFGYPIPAEKHNPRHQLELIKHLQQLPCPHLVLQGNVTRTTHTERLMPWLAVGTTEWVWTDGFAQSISALNQYFDAWLNPRGWMMRQA